MVMVSDHLVTVFGGSGFVGRHLVRALTRRGYRVRVAVRRPELAGFLMTAGAVGQVHAVQANLRYPDSVAAAAEGADAVVNLVGLLHESGRNTFDAVHTFGAGAVARAARDAGARALVQMSAIGADALSPGRYGRTKAEGERAVLSEFPSAVITRPSIVFGPEDNFFNRFAAMARISPFLPLVGGGTTLFQPVFVDDVAQAIVRAVEGELVEGATYELGGPEVLTFRQLLDFVQRVTHRKRFYVPLPFRLASLNAKLLQYLPNPPLTPDQVEMLRVSNVVSEQAKAEGRTLEGMGIDPVAIEVVVPSYLWRFRKAGQFEKAT
jgi:NADH dehydrogenase